MKKNIFRKVSAFGLLATLLLIPACFTFVSIIQPDSVMTGQPLTSTLLVKVFGDPFWKLDKTPHYAIIGMMIPEDWQVDSVYYKPGNPGDIGPNTCSFLHPDSADSETGGKMDYWTDTLTVRYPPPQGMHWVVYQSDTKDSTSLDTSFVEVTIEMTSGQTAGEFNIGYFVSNSALDFTDENWYAVSLENPIEIIANQPPMIDSLDALSFNEDDTLQVAVSSWYAFVSDELPDSLLDYNVSGGSMVKIARVDGGFIFSAPENWFGQDTLQLRVSDPDGLADTASFAVNVISVNDLPRLELPESVHFRDDSSASIDLWQAAGDVETADSLLTFKFDSSNDSLNWQWDNQTGLVRLSAAGWSGSASFYVTVMDADSAATRDTITVLVDPSTAISAAGDRLPQKYQLFQNYPNPFNPVTRIRFALKESGSVTLMVFNSLGQRVWSEKSGRLPAGFHEIELSGQNLSSGVYYYRIAVNNFSSVRKMLLIK